LSSLLTLAFQELWNAFCDVVNDWYIVLRSALITLPADQQFRLIDIYAQYLLRLAQSEEYAAVQDST
jgi:phytoene/squalene synthetase